MKPDTERFLNFLLISLMLHLLLFMFVTVRLPEKNTEEDAPIMVEVLPPEKETEKRFADVTNRTERQTKLPGEALSSSGVVNKDLAYITPKTQKENKMKRPLNEQEPGTFKKETAEIKQLLPSHELINKLAREYRPNTDADVETSNIISLDTTELKYISYMTKVKRQIDLAWTYPMLAIQRGEHGVLVLQFTILATGDLKEVKIIRSTGSNILDRTAVEAIQKAAPYPPFPTEWHEKELTVAARMEYILGYTVVQ